MKTTLRYVPNTIGILTPDGFCSDAPVLGVIIHPEGMHPAKCCIRSDYKAIELQTKYGPRWFGSEEAYMDSTSQVVMAINDQDKVASKWKLAA